MPLTRIPAFPYPALIGVAAENAAGIPLVDPDFWHVFVEALQSPIPLTAKFGLNPRDSQAAEDRLRNLAIPLGPTKGAKAAPFITVGKQSQQTATMEHQHPNPLVLLQSRPTQKEERATADVLGVAVAT